MLQTPSSAVHMRQVTPRQIHQRAVALTFQPRLRPDSRAGVAPECCVCLVGPLLCVTLKCEIGPSAAARSAVPRPPCASASYGFESGVEDVYGH